MTERQAAKELGISPTTLRWLISTGHISATKVRYYSLSKADIRDAKKILPKLKQHVIPYFEVSLEEDRE